MKVIVENTQISGFCGLNVGDVFAFAGDAKRIVYVKTSVDLDGGNYQALGDQDKQGYASSNARVLPAIEVKVSF